MKEVQKDLNYWRSRAGQIMWRLDKVRSEVLEMERDLKECEENIKKIQVPCGSEGKNGNDG